MRFARASGVLLHPTSLPGRFGIGDFGAEARRFVDFLAAAGQAFWQIMPLGPPGFGDSPYASNSAFAGNVTLVSPEGLVEAGFLAEADLRDTPDLPAERVDFGKVIAFKRGLLERAFEVFARRLPSDPALQADHARVLRSAAPWLDDYALFAALKDEHGGAEWHAWPAALARREPAALDGARRDLAERVEAQRFFQYVFLSQWRALRHYANERGVRIIGDMPIFVAYDSADVWARPRLFKLAADGRPSVVAGVPPDAFSATGQLWGSPLYAWDRLREDGFAWWIDRVCECLTLVDVVRLDHFRGFAACWEVPAEDETAEGGQWVASPGRELLSAITGALGSGDLPIIAEDLGLITPDVHRLREEFGLPGMRVLQFAWNGDPHDAHLPHEYNRAVVAYTGTHDNDTVMGWLAARSAPGASEEERRERDECLRYLGSDGSALHWDFIRAIHMSVAGLAIVPMQDVLGLGSEGRMNTPGRPDGNWAWRLRPDALTEPLGLRLRELTALYGRLP